MVIIVFGLPGSGKSYFAKRLSEHLNAVYISTDKIRNDIMTLPDYNQKEKYSIYQILLKTINFNVDTVIDGTFYKNELRNSYSAEAANHNKRIYFIEIIANEKIIKERTSKQRVDSDADYSVYLKIRNEFEPFKKPHLVLESKDNNIQEMINLTIDYLNQFI